MCRLIFAFLFPLVSAIGQPGGGCPQLPITLSGPTEYCIGMTGAALGVMENYQSYYWLPGQQTAQNVVLNAGSHTVIITHNTGCQDTLDFTVTQVSNPPQPVITADGPTQFCQGANVVLSAPEGYPSYMWSSGSVTEDITVFESGIYVVSIIDWIGCESAKCN